jgi:hypothetical protein
MERTSLIAWRRRGKKFPEAEAQRRARAREQGGDGDQPFLSLDARDVLSVAAPFELRAQDASPLPFELTGSRDQEGITFQFSLHCYRIAHRYRSAVDDAKAYLDRLPAH